MSDNDKKSRESHEVSKKYIELICKLSDLCDKYNHSFSEGLAQLREIKEKKDGNG